MSPAWGATFSWALGVGWRIGARRERRRPRLRHGRLILRLVQERRQLGRPWTAAVVILGTVALFTLVAGLLLNSRAIAGRYPAGRAADATPPRP